MHRESRPWRRLHSTVGRKFVGPRNDPRQSGSIPGYQTPRLFVPKAVLVRVVQLNTACVLKCRGPFQVQQPTTFLPKIVVGGPIPGTNESTTYCTSHNDQNCVTCYLSIPISTSSSERGLYHETRQKLLVKSDIDKQLRVRDVT